MRDLYNRANKLEYWLKRINTDLDGSDKEDLLCLVRYMQDQERSSILEDYDLINEKAGEIELSYFGYIVLSRYKKGIGIR